MSERAEALYEQARALPPAARAALLEQACEGDDRLAKELRSLLEHAEPAEAFFSGLTETIATLPAGHSVGHYRLLGVLGTGGMGTVYRAHDSRLARDVALKFLPPHLSAQPGARERLLVEARAAAGLEHPNVCSIHEIGETTDGRLFIAMACYEGETVKERLAGEPLGIEEAVSIARQIARGLAAAHARGIVHRDVKPGNVMLCADGTVRLLDFGLAKLSDVTITGPNVTPGTIAYMSPEQARGAAVDARTDLWSLGVVLYEMLAGERPFRGENDRTVIQAIVHERPAPLRRRRPGTPGWLACLVERLLEKEPGLRYRSADELLRDLTARSPPVRLSPRQRGGPALRPITLAGAGVLAVAGALYAARSHRASNASEVTGVLAAPAPEITLGTTPSTPRVDRDPVTATVPAPAIAVLPFTVRGEGLDLWREGMVDLLAMGLEGAGGLRAIHSRTVLARWREEVGDRPADLPRALGVARRIRARYALVGSVVRAGRQVRLASDVYDLTDGHSLGQAQVEGSPDSMLALADRLGMQTLGVILEKAPGEIPPIDMAGISTPSLVALKAYLEGEAHFRRSEYRLASQAWERAVRADSMFALAYFGLTEAYGWEDENENPNRAQEALDRSRRLADRLPSAEKTIVRAQWTGTPEHNLAIEEAVRGHPDDARAWYALGEVYYHQAAAMRGPEEAERAFRRAAELQPATAPYRAHLLDLAFTWLPDSARVAREVEAYGRVAPHASRTQAARIALWLGFGDIEARAGAKAALDTLAPPAAVMVYEFLAHPKFAGEREAVFRAIDHRLDDNSRAYLRRLRFRHLALLDGRVREAMALLDDPLTPHGVRGCGGLYLLRRGLPVSDAVLERRLAASRADTSSFANRFWVTCAASYAAERGRWSEHAALLSHARAVAGRARAAGDSASAREWDEAAREAAANEVWRRGRKEEALRVFESLLAGDASWDVLWQVGQLSLELGRLDQAERAFRALRRWDGPLAYLYLGRILERTGRPAEARQAYEFFTDAWRNADPELQPVVDEARRALARLAGSEQ